MTITTPSIGSFVSDATWYNNQANFPNATKTTWQNILVSGLNRSGTAVQPVPTGRGLNIVSTHDPEYFSWQIDAGSNEDDGDTEKWYPQGICGTAHASFNSALRHRALVVSWYGNDEENYTHKGVRLSFIDRETYEYRHVLLVQNAAYIDSTNAQNSPRVKNLDGSTTFPALFYLSAEDKARYHQHSTFAPIPIHSGGIAWYKNFIYVVDTKMGIRVFDPTRIYPAEADENKNDCGRKDGLNYAFDYRYIMPQIGFYKTLGTDPNSFISVGNGLTEGGLGYQPCLWIGQYLSDDSGSKYYIGKLDQREGWTNAERSGFPKLFRLMLNSDGSINTSSGVATTSPKDEGAIPVYGMQGAYRANGISWLSVTGRSCYQDSSARFIIQDKNAAAGSRSRWPLGAEGLYLEESTQRLWCLTEYPNGSTHDCAPPKRVFFSVDFESYQP